MGSRVVGEGLFRGDVSRGGEGLFQAVLGGISVLIFV